MKKNLLQYYYIAAFYLCSTLIMFAQDPGTNDGSGTLEGDGDTTPSAPIDDYIWVLALVGLLLAFMWFRSIQNNKIKEKTS